MQPIYWRAAIAIIITTMAGCKTLKTPDDSQLKDLSAPRQAGYAPGTHYALKSNIRRLFESIRLVQSSVQDGAYVYTVTELNFQQFTTNASGITAVMNLDVSVDASKSQALPLWASAGVDLSFRGRAQAVIDIINQNGRIVVAYRGTSWPMPLTAHINTWTNARIARGMVHSKARQQAQAAVPSTKAQIERTVDKELRTSIAQQSGDLQGYFQMIAEAMYDVPGAIPKLTSDSAGAYFQHHIPVVQGANVQNPPSTPSDVDAGFLFHQDTFTSLLGKNLSGKKIPLENIGTEVCESFSKTPFKFCVTGKPKVPVDLALTFDTKKPVTFTFDKNAIVLTLRAKAHVATNEETRKAVESWTSQIMNRPAADSTSDSAAADGPRIEAVSPQIEVRVEYTAGNRSFTRKDAKAKITSPDSELGFLLSNKMFQEGLIRILEAKLTESLPAVIDVPAAPSYASDNRTIRSLDAALVVMRKEHFGISQNWLYTYWTYCSQQDVQTSLGINMREINDSGGIPRLIVTSVEGYSPAAKSVATGVGTVKKEDIEVNYRPGPGLVKGDIIYSIDGNDQIVGSPELFSATLAGKSLTPNRKVRLNVGRKVKLEGLDAPVWLMLDFETSLRKVCRKAS